jgi:hypothetical protein
MGVAVSVGFLRSFPGWTNRFAGARGRRLHALFGDDLERGGAGAVAPDGRVMMTVRQRPEEAC